MKAEYIAFRELRVSRNVLPGLFRFLFKSVFLPLAGIAVIAIGVGAGNHMQRVDWPAIGAALKGQSERPITLNPGLYPSQVSQGEQSATGVPRPSSTPAMPMPMPMPLNITPLPAGIPAPVEILSPSTTAASKAASADAAQSDEVSLRGTTKGRRTTGEQQDDSTVHLKPAIEHPTTPRTPNASTASRIPGSTMRAVAISENRLTVQMIGANGLVRQNQIAPGDNLPNGQTLLELDASAGKYTTNAGTWALWEQK